MGKLHELLAVESELAGQAKKVLKETKQRFKNDTFFSGSVTSFEPMREEDEHLRGEEHVEIGIDVEERLAYTAGSVAKWLDAVCQKEKTNQLANADIVIDGVVIANNVPATMLLGLETKLREVRENICSIPTLDVKVKWIDAEGLGSGIKRAEHDTVTVRHRKTLKPAVLYEATKEHPAQVKEAYEDIPVVKVVKTHFSSAVTSARAHDILSKLDELIRAVKKARQRANSIKVEKAVIGKALFDYVLK